MFKVQQSPIFTRPVTVHVPEGGGTRDDTFSATFKAIPSSEVARFDLGTEAGTKEFLRAVTKDLGDLADAAGEPLKCNAEIFEQVLDWPFTRLALASAYFEGVTAARTGNSDGLPASGRAAARH